MKTRIMFPLVAVWLAAFSLPPEVWAQSTNVRPRNKNQSVKFKSGIFRGSGNLIESNAVTSSIGGGQSNAITSGADYAVVGGGFKNVVSNDYDTVGGGTGNAASGGNSVVSGGETNYATANGATVAGGSMNEANGARSAIGGGFNNTTTGSLAAIPGGVGNSATNYSLAAGRNAMAEHESSFVWGSQPGIVYVPTESFANNSFTVRCHGGARFYTADGTAVGPRVAAGGTDFVSSSDSNLKTKVTAVDPREILAKLSRLPVTEWEYKHNPDRRYIGPMAQDFHATFGLGDDDKGIGTLDSDGVMYAAIQGLLEELKVRDQSIEELQAKSAEVEALRNELRALREEIRRGAPPAP